MRLRLLVAAAFALLGLVVVGPPLVAHAEVSGQGCGAHLANVDVAGVDSQNQSTAIPVDRGQVITVDLTGETGSPATIHVDYGIAGGITVGRDGSGTSYAARVADYADVPGLYLVQARTGPNGSCTAAALVDVRGSALSTPLGIGALAATLAGGVAVAGGAVIAGAGTAGVPPAPDPGSPAGAGGIDLVDGALKQAEPVLPPPPGPQEQQWVEDSAQRLGEVHYDPATNSWYQVRAGFIPDQNIYGARKAVVRVALCGAVLPMALVMTTLAMMGALPSPPPQGRPQDSRRTSVRWRPRLSVIALAGSVIGSVGAIVLMELSGSAYPTRGWAIRALVAGLLVGVVLPSAGNAVAVARIRRRLAAWDGAAPPGRR